MAVEWLRSCYAADFRLFRNRPDLIKRGEYYFAADATPFYSHTHNLGSEIWRDRNHPQEVRLGEIAGTRAWRKGDAPAVAARENAIGKPDCIRYGESVENAISADDLVDGWPADCVLPADEVDELWDKVSSYDSCVTQRIYASLIVMAYVNDEANIRQTIEDWLGASVVVTFTPHTGLNPALITLRLGDWMSGILDGTQNAQELALQAFIFPAGPVSFGPFSSHPFWFGAATYVINLLRAAGMNASERFMLAGHSYGSAVTYNVLARFRHWEPDRELKYLTFASPKIGDERMVRLIQSCDGIAIINDSDFVSILPPDRLTIAPFLSIFTQSLLLLYTEWWRPPNQWLLDIDGGFTANTVPLIDHYTLLSLLAEVFEGRVLDPSTSHRMPEYVGRLETRCPDVCWPINIETQHDVWSPTGAIVLNGNKRPRGALIFAQSIPPPSPEPGLTCETATPIELDVIYTYFDLPTDGFWTLTGAAPGTYHVELSGVSEDFTWVFWWLNYCLSVKSGLTDSGCMTMVTDQGIVLWFKRFSGTHTFQFIVRTGPCP